MRVATRTAFVLSAVLAVTLGAGASSFAGPAPLSVDRTDDDASAATCSDVANDCSLRGAILNANLDPDADTINLPAGVYILSDTISGPENDGLDDDLDIYNELTILGADTATTIIDGAGAMPLGDIRDGATVAMSDLTLRHGYSPGAGGGAWIAGSLTLTNVIVTENSAGLHGAGLYLRGEALTLIDSTVANNDAMGVGGGIGVNDGALSLTRTTVSGNTAGGDGGGIQVSDGTITLINSTISGNSANGSGGGIDMQGSGDLTNVTVANNTADADANGAGNAGGLNSVQFGFELRNTIVGDNIDTGGEAPDCAITGDGSITSAGHNLVEDLAGCIVNGLSKTDITGDGPLLGPLADNGGATKTHSLNQGSPALDAGNDADCTKQDQRGVSRVGQCDIGAFERGLEPGQSVWGDMECDGDVDPVDALLILRFVAGLPRPVGGNPCQPIGEQFEIKEEPLDILFGDVDCDGDVDSVDALIVLRHVAGFPFQPPIQCPPIGSVVQFVPN